MTFGEEEKWELRTVNSEIKDMLKIGDRLQNILPFFVDSASKIEPH